MTKDLSIIISAHHEGLIAHKTMRSVERAVKKLAQQQVSYEIIVTIDNGNAETTGYFSRYKNDKNVSIYEISHGDLSASRNFGISKAEGAIIATLDADDLVSENWFADAYQKLEAAKKDVVLHTHYSVNFGTQNVVWEKFDSRSKEEDALIMTWANRWDSAVMARRGVFERFPYQPNTHGFGSEDWHFNSQTLAANIPHLVVPETILFVRRKDVSEMTIQATSRRTVHYTELLDFNFIRSIDITPYLARQASQTSSLPAFSQVPKRLVKQSYHHVKRLPKIGSTVSKIAVHLKPLVVSPAVQRFPLWLTNEWKTMHQIEKETFPSNELLQSIPLYHSEMYELGIFYHRLVKEFRKKPDYIIFVPYLVKGGADLVAINYANHIKRLKPEWNVAVIATEDQPTYWADKLDSSVDFIPFGELAEGLGEDLKLQLLARLIVQSECKRLHIIQSPLMFTFCDLYETFLKENNYTVYAAAFCEDTDREGRISGHVHSGIPRAYPAITKIFTDNGTISKLLVDEYAFDPKQFVTHYQPAPKITGSWKKQTDAPFRLLWAARIAKQKRPDLLLEIAKKLNPAKFHIDMYGYFEEDFSPEMFAHIPSLSYNGHFNGIGSLPLNKYDAYLYTSENDGLPNVLLEVAGFGLPIIASNVGGVPEVVNNETGILVNKFDQPEKYVEAITTLANNPEKLQEISQAARKKISASHSEESFDALVTRDILAD